MEKPRGGSRKTDIIVTTEGKFNAKAFVEQFLAMVRKTERESEISSSEAKKTPKTNSPSANEE